MAIEVKMYRTKAGTKTVLVNNKRKFIHVLMMDGKLVVHKVPKTEARYMRDVVEVKRRRSIQPAVRVFSNYGRQQGATKEAKKFIREARAS
jgi:hypothetical protein